MQRLTNLSQYGSINQESYDVKDKPDSIDSVYSYKPDSNNGDKLNDSIIYSFTGNYYLPNISNISNNFYCNEPNHNFASYSMQSHDNQTSQNSNSLLTQQLCYSNTQGFMKPEHNCQFPIRLQESLQSCSPSNSSVSQDYSKSLIKDEKYIIRRQKNNIAAKKCRDNKKRKSQELQNLVAMYEKENAELKEKISSIKNQINVIKNNDYN